MRSSKMIFVFILLYGVLVAFLVPPLQTPDESSHIWHVYRSVGADLEGFCFQVGGHKEFREMSANPGSKVDVPMYKSMITEAPIRETSGNIIHTIKPEAIKYIPAIIGVEIASLLHLPAFWIFALGEIAGVVFYTIVCLQALRIMPYRKELLLVLMLFPMSIQQAGSFSYDATLISVSFLFVASFIRILYEGKYKKRDILALVIMLLWIAYIKPPYLLLGLIFLIIMSKKQRLISAACVGAAVVIGMFAGIHNYWVQVLWQCVLHPGHTLMIYGTTIAKTFDKWMKEAFGVFGWMDFGVPDIVVIITFVLFFALAILPDEGEQKGHVLTVPEALWGGVVFTFTTFGIMTAMINHTIRMHLFGSEWTYDNYDLVREFLNLKMVEGVQGRYFLPIVILPMLAFLPCSIAIYPALGQRIDGMVKKTGLNRTALILLYNIVMLLMVVYILLRRYWIA